MWPLVLMWQNAGKTITAYLRWRPELKLGKEKREMVAKKGRVRKSSGKEGRKVVRLRYIAEPRLCVYGWVPRASHTGLWF